MVLELLWERLFDFVAVLVIGLLALLKFTAVRRSFTRNCRQIGQNRFPPVLVRLEKEVAHYLLIKWLVFVACRCLYPPSYGSVTEQNLQVTYRCREEFILVGNEVRYCNETTGEWSGSDPSCKYLGLGGTLHAFTE